MHDPTTWHKQQDKLIKKKLTIDRWNFIFLLLLLPSLQLIIQDSRCNITIFFFFNPKFKKWLELGNWKLEIDICD